MARLGRGGFLALAVVFHLVYIYSIFDIYFVSPVVHGMQAYRVQQDRAPAKRLVLYVGDGLRADKAFQSFPDPSPPDPANADLTPRPLAPFLRSRVLEHGTFGISHTRVPTESRPGHVALIAGLYEDVSAVTTGWKLNPVDFDSVFNRSRHTWSWGSPDILPMFSEGAVPGRVDADQYPPEFEDYTMDATMLDTWVFDKVKAMFKEAKTNATLDNILRQDQNVLLLHLLGLDTTGHSYRPYSKEYLHNIKVVDKGVEEITKLIDDFYTDDQTAFVFTADHGMSDWGSHGDGHPDNTRTPLIAWGSGIARPKVFPKGNAPGHEDGVSHDWNLNQIQRHDVSQADIAALMAYLAGLEFPVNSVGELPLSYLSTSTEEKAKAALVNTKGILEMYRVKEDEKKAAALKYQPYPPFGKMNGSVAERVSVIETAIFGENYDEAIVLSHGLLKDGLQGLRYLQTYDWLFLRALITLGYLGWIAYALTTVLDLHVLQGNVAGDRSITTIMIFSSILVLLFSFFITDRSPLTYYAYAFFPVFFWEEVFARRKSCIAGVKILFGDFQGPSTYMSFGIQLLLYIGVLEALVQSYFHRIIFTICYVLAAFWPSLYGAKFARENSTTLLAWAAGCLALSTFTLLEVVKVENANTITAGGVLMFGAGSVYLLFEHDVTSRSRSKKSASTPSYVSRIVMGMQIGIILLTVLVTRSSVASLQSKKGLPLGNQVVGWFALIASIVLPFLHRLAPNYHYLHRLVVIFLTFSPCFILLTISYEGLFYFTFCATLLTWVRLEHAIYQHHSTSQSSASSAGTKTPPQPHMNGTVITSTSFPPSDITNRRTHRALTLPDLRTSLFFLFLLQSAFFSTGNIASISSFSLDAVYRLIPIFDPFSQAALLLYKIMVPFALISAALGILNRRLGLQSSALFMVVMSISDVMTLNFFWMVKDEGSWLDIGTTISHFVIASLIGVFVAGLEGVSEVLIKGVEMDEQHFEQRVRRESGVEVVGNGDAKKSAGKRKVAVDERPVID
jgi:GPI ethanolamine phosphate transferase 1